MKKNRQEILTATLWEHLAHIVPFGWTLGTFFTVYNMKHNEDLQGIYHLSSVIGTSSAAYLSSVTSASILLCVYMCLYVLFMCMVNIYISIEDVVIHVS